MECSPRHPGVPFVTGLPARAYGRGVLIRIAHPYTSEAGDYYGPGDNADLPELEAFRVMAAGLGASPTVDVVLGPVRPVAPPGSAVIATLGDGVLDVITDAPSPWGLTAGGEPYYDPAGPAAAERAALLTDSLELAHF